MDNIVKAMAKAAKNPNVALVLYAMYVSAIVLISNVMVHWK